MKSKLLLISFFISSMAFGQQACYFTHSVVGPPNVISFMPGSILSSPPYYYVWDFGDNTSSFNVDPIHTYNSTGIFWVCLSVYDSSTGALYCHWCDTIDISNPVGGGCSFYVDTLGGNTVVFNSQPSITGSIIYWDFGNGDTAVGSIYTYTYPNPGQYLVCMTETDTLGNTVCTMCNPVVIGGTPANCSFTSFADTTNGSVQFYANVTVGSTVSWSFGDNTIGTGIDPHHTYNSPGTYLVCMTSTYNSVTCTTCDSVTVGNPAVGSCTFTYAVDQIDTFLVHFVASGILTGGNIFTWDFGDGNTGHGAIESHLYNSSGTYFVCLTVTDSLTGTVLCNTCMPVTINGNTQTCNAYFISTSLGLTAYFIDLSNLSSAATYYWSFGDGAYSDSHFPHHTYALAGTYNTCLTVTDNNCTSTTCLLTTVDSVINNNPVCQAYFAIVQISPFELAVVNLSSGVNIHFHWDFGDGQTSDLAYPSHYYDSTGTYLLCLTVSDFIGCSSTFCDTLSVDSLGNIAHRGLSGFTINIISPATLTGVKEISSPTVFAVYPNPVSSTLTVSITNEMTDVITYKVFALDGREVTTGNFTRKDNTLDVSGWNSGAYILELRNAEGFKSHQKIIKE